MEDAHAKTSEEVLKFFGTNDEVGLTPDQVKTYQAKYGPNGKSIKFPFLFFLCFRIFAYQSSLEFAISLLHFMI